MTLPAAGIPAPPSATRLTGTPDEQVNQLIDAFGRTGEARGAALLAAFTRAGIPVIDDSGNSVTTADGIGIPWATVWTAGIVPDPKARYRLSQLMSLLAVPGDSPTLDTAAVGTELLNGLRKALAADPTTKGPGFIARLARVESLTSTGVDFTDRTVTPEQVKVSAPTATVLVSAALMSLATEQPPALRAAGASGLATSAAIDVGPPPKGCAEDNIGQWALWLTSKIAGGAKLFDYGWDGLFSVFCAMQLRISQRQFSASLIWRNSRKRSER